MHKEEKFLLKNLEQETHYELFVKGTKEQRNPKFSAEIFLSAEIPFPLKGNRNQFLYFWFRFSRNQKHHIIFGFNRNFVAF